MKTVLRFQWLGVSKYELQNQVRAGVTVTGAGPVPGTLVDVVIEADAVTPQDEDDVKNYMDLAGWLFLAKDPTTL